jgi:hypothetical protein
VARAGTGEITGAASATVRDMVVDDVEDVLAAMSRIVDAALSRMCKTITSN